LTIVTTDLAELLRQVDPSVVGARVRAAREVFGVPPGDLADAIGLDSAALDELERGIRTPDLALLSAVAEATATSPELLVTGLSRDVLADLHGDLDLAGFTLSSQDSSAARATAERILEQLDAAGATAPHLDRAARRLRAKPSRRPVTSPRRSTSCAG